MKRQILFIRHAKSAYPEGVSDEFRPISPEGVQKTLKICTWLKKQDFTPELLISSSAKRARETAEIIQQKVYPSCELHIQHSLYTFSPFEVLTFIKNLPETLNRVVLFGHNPAFHECVERLSQTSIEKFPTTGTALISFDVHNWNAISNGTLEWMMFPKML